MQFQRKQQTKMSSEFNHDQSAKILDFCSQSTKMQSLIARALKNQFSTTEKCVCLPRLFGCRDGIASGSASGTLVCDHRKCDRQICLLAVVGHSWPLHGAPPMLIKEEITTTKLVNFYRLKQTNFLYIQFYRKDHHPGHW